MKLNPMRLPLSSLAGITVIVLYCVFTFASLTLYPTTYSPVTNWLSDLGNSSYNPRGAVLYNIGCILTGIALFPFFIGLYEWYTVNKRFRLGLMVWQAEGCVAAFSLIMIGVFSEDSGSLHTLWSAIFFILIMGVLLGVGSLLFTHQRYIRKIAYYGFIVAVIDIMLIFFQSPWLEWFTVFSALGYVGLLSYNLLKK